MERRFVHLIKFTQTVILLAVILCCVNFAYGQVLNDLQNNFSSNKKAALQERIYVHTNKGTYLTGETILFKIYNTDGSTNKPATISKVVYADILDKNNNPVLQAKIAMKNGVGNGSFQLPSSLNTGNYHLRAYTNWMKNFDPGYYFNQNVIIINAQKDITQTSSKDIKYDIQFFPEGGHLVEGLNSKIAFKISASDGSAINATGAILDQRGDTVVRFSTLKFGIGSFTFKPMAGLSYKAIVKINGKPLTAELPAISTSGYVIHADLTARSLEINVKAIGVVSQNISVLVHTNNAIAAAETNAIVNGEARFTINKAALNEGVSYVTLFNDQRQPVCERLIFNRPGRNLNITANTDAAQYSTRTKVSLSINTQNQNGKNLAANMSLSVYRLDSLQKISKANIAAYLWLSAAVKGYIESPDYYLDNNTKESNEALDNLLLSQGWTQFDWTDIIANKQPTYNYLPEYTGPLVTANIINTVTNLPVADINAYLTIPGKYHQFYVSKSDSTGKLIFNTQGSIGSKEIIIKTNPLRDSTYRIDVISPFSEQYEVDFNPDVSIAPALYRSLSDNNINAQVNQIFNRDELEQPDIDTTYFYKKPPYRYNLDDYVRFKTLAEVIHEYVRFVSVSYENGQAHLRMSYNKALLPNETLALVDGEPIFDAGSIYKLDPLKIKRMDVINNKYIYGPVVFDGFISLTTYNGDRGNVILDPKAITINYEGLQQKRKFYSPVYDTDEQKKSTLPDFRTTLFWEPDLYTDDKGAVKANFYTGDKAGKYIGVIEGLSQNGEAGYKQFYFEVKK